MLFKSLKPTKHLQLAKYWRWISYQHCSSTISYLATSQQERWLWIFLHLQKNQYLVNENYNQSVNSPKKRSKNQLTSLLSPVMLDSSMAKEWPLIKIPSAGTWKKTQWIKSIFENDNAKEVNRNYHAHLITYLERYNITNN